MPISNIISVMDDLELECNNIEEQVSAFRAEEMARAAIAEANYRAYLERQKNKNGPQNEEDRGDLSLEIISNQNRGLDSDPPRGEVRVLY